MNGLKFEDAVFSAATTSSVVDLERKTMLALLMPQSWTGTAVTFECSDEAAGTFTTLYKEGANVSVAVAADKQVVLAPADFVGVRFVKLVSGSSETGTIKVITRELA